MSELNNHLVVVGEEVISRQLDFCSDSLKPVLVRSVFRLHLVLDFITGIVAAGRRSRRTLFVPLLCEFALNEWQSDFGECPDELRGGHECEERVCKPL